ncbi:MAG: hypothetical protein P8166_07105 [Candidatus Thiodiazotropha sp.]
MLLVERCLLFEVVLFAPFSLINLYAQEVGEGGNQEGLFSTEYLHPSSDDRDIRTTNLNAYARIRGLSSDILSIYAGLTATYAVGDITQLEGEIEQGTLREVNYDTRAGGLGPGLLVDLRLWRSRRLSAHLSGSGSLIVYSRDFPAGGDKYNFMWRGGPALRYHIGNGRRVGLGYQWMHVSNGQGVGSRNPSYEAQGFALQYTTSFD